MLPELEPRASPRSQGDGLHDDNPGSKAGAAILTEAAVIPDDVIYLVIT